MILRFLLWRLITRWLPGQVEAVFLCKVWRSMGISFLYNVYRNCRFWILQEMSYFLVHHFLSFVLTFSDICLLNFSNCSLTEQTCKKFSRNPNLGIYWLISLTGMKPSIGFCYIYSPGLGTNDLYVRILKRFSNAVHQNKAKYLLPATKSTIIQVNRQSGNRAIRIMDNSIPLNVEVVIGILLGSRGKFCLPIALQSNAKPNK